MNLSLKNMCRNLSWCTRTSVFSTLESRYAFVTNRSKCSWGASTYVCVARVFCFIGSLIMNLFFVFTKQYMFILLLASP